MFKVRLPVTCTLPHIAKKLSNGVDLIVVEDPLNTKPAAAMAFGVGKNNDPKEFPGLAHFCEHMLFMGTEKYPSEDAYHTAVKRNGGSCNAFTSNDITCYHFSSSLDAYKGIVDMFLEFFIAPSFNESAVNRELNAVNSEDERNHTNDHRRIEEMMKTFIVPDHPRSRYGSGNLTTLQTEPEAKGLSVHKSLRTFFDTHYVAECSSLVLYSPFPAEEMMALVEPTLLRLKQGPTPPQSFVPRGEVLLPNTAAVWCNVLNTSKQRSVSLKWQLPSGTNDFLKSPHSYLSHMVGHEVEGSVLAALRKKGLGTALSAGGSDYDGENAEFTVRIVLTDKGLAAIEDVASLVFSYFELMRRAGPHDAAIKATYTEMKAEQVTRFEYKEVSNPSSHCSSLSCGAVHYGGELAFCGGALAEDVNSLVDSFNLIPLMGIDRCIIVLSVGDEKDLALAASSPSNRFIGKTSAVDGSGGLVFDRTTRFHKMPYNVTPLPADMLARLSAEKLASASLDPLLSIPQPNPFVSDSKLDFTVFGPPSTEKIPQRVATEYGYALIKRNESHLQQPKLYTMLNLFMANAPTIADKYYREVMVSCVHEALIDTLYYASLVGLSLEIVSNGSGLVFRAAGPSPLVPQSLLTLIQQVLDPKLLKQSEEVFARQNKKKQLSLLTTFEGQPSDLGNAEHQRYFAADCSFSWRDAFGFSPDAAYEGYCAYIDKLFDTKTAPTPCRSELVVDGNMLSETHMQEALVQKVDALLKRLGFVAAEGSAFIPYNDFFVPQPLLPTNSITTTAAAEGGPSPVRLHLINLPPFSPSNVNAFVSLKLYLGECSPDRYPLLKVLANIISSPFFNTLRSTETLGYVVHASIVSTSHREAYLSFSVQSPVANPLYLYSRIHAFIDAFEHQVLSQLTEKELEGAVKGLIHTLKQKTTCVRSDGARITADRGCIYGFDWREKEVARLEEGVTREDLLLLYRQYISNASPSRVGVAVFVNSSKLPLDGVAEEDLASPAGVVLPSMRKPDASAAVGPAVPSASSAVADTRLVMATFDGDAPQRAVFNVLKSKADAVSRHVAVPHQ